MLAKCIFCVYKMQSSDIVLEIKKLAQNIGSQNRYLGK